MAKTRRKYKGNATATTLSGSFSAGATSVSITAATGWPTSGPFYAVIDPGTSSEEKILVGSISTTVLSSITRGVDDTTDQTHASGATIYPVFTAVDADEANELASTWTTKGDLVAHGASTFVRVAAGTNNHVLMADSAQASGLKYAQVGENSLASDAVTTAKIADSAVTSAKIANGTIVDADINASAAIALSKLATGALPTAITVESANLVDGTIVDADINASAAIALSKLATGALPTAITVASANLVNGTIVEADLADGAVTSAKILDGTIVNADINASAAIALSKLETGALPTAITVASANIVDGTIAEADLADGSVSAAKVKAEGWTSYTPSVKQPSALSNVTVNYAKYIQLGKTVICNGLVTIGATSGTASNAVVVSLPVTSAVNANIVLGSVQVVDSSALTSYSGVAVQNSTTEFVIQGDWSSANSWGGAPNLALASNDQIRFSLSYEAA